MMIMIIAKIIMILIIAIFVIKDLKIWLALFKAENVYLAQVEQDAIEDFNFRFHFQKMINIDSSEVINVKKLEKILIFNF